MKQSQLKSLVKTIIREMYGGEEWSDPDYRSMMNKHYGAKRGPEYHKLKFPCPDCHKPNAISQWHKDHGYHCDACTRNLEGPMEENRVIPNDLNSPRSDSPVGALNDLAGKVAGNIRSGQITSENALTYITKKTKSPNDLEYVKWRINAIIKTGFSPAKPLESTEPSIGGSYADQQTGTDTSNVRPERDSLNDPILKEYSNKETRFKAMKHRPDADKLKLIYLWVLQGSIDYEEFVALVNRWAKETDTRGFGAS